MVPVDDDPDPVLDKKNSGSDRLETAGSRYDTRKKLNPDPVLNPIMTPGQNSYWHSNFIRNKFCYR